MTDWSDMAEMRAFTAEEDAIVLDTSKTRAEIAAELKRSIGSISSRRERLRRATGLASRPVCAIPDCELPATARGWCGLHYQAWRKTGDPLQARPRRASRFNNAPRPCAQCGKSFKPRATTERGVASLCSRECRAAAQRDRVTLTCERCGKAFERQPSHVGRYCSDHCWRATQALDPWNVGPRTLLARSCETCGEVKSPESFKAVGDYQAHKCRDCKARDTAEWHDANWRATIETAHSHGNQWTGAELEIAMRTDLTARQAAEILGRTSYAVYRARNKVRNEPKWSQVAGV